MGYRRKTCTACRADIQGDGSTWLCNAGARHCTRCYETLDERLCLFVHDPVYNAPPDVAATVRRYKQAQAAADDGRSREPVANDVPTLALKLAQRRLRKRKAA
jgi:hypothetical protein